MPENAASSAPSWSPRPSQRALPRAARSVVRAYSSHMHAKRVSAPTPGSCSATCATGDSPVRLDTLEDELHHLRDRQLDVRVLDHRHTVATGPLDDRALQQTDVVEPFEVAIHRPHTVRGGVAD